jgi:transcriptional regulator with XRE-family HTH domain
MQEKSFRDLRNARGLTLKEASEQIGISLKDLVNAETPNRGLQKKFFNLIPKIASVYNVSAPKVREAISVTSKKPIPPNDYFFDTKIDFRIIMPKMNLTTIQEPVHIGDLIELVTRMSETNAGVVIDIKETLLVILKERTT